MQFEYQNNKVQKILCNHIELQKRVGPELGKKIMLRLKQLEAAENFNMYLTKIALGKPHPLNCDLDNCFGISITGNYRIVVEPLYTKLDIESLKECKVVKIKGVLDYHGEKNEWLIP